MLYGPKNYGYNVSTCEAACKYYKCPPPVIALLGLTQKGRARYIALQDGGTDPTNGGWCSCDNEYGNPVTSVYKPANEEDCGTLDLDVNGVPFRHHGGGFTNAIYENRQHIKPPYWGTPAMNYIGCYTDDSTRDMAHGPKQFGCLFKVAPQALMMDG